MIMENSHIFYPSINDHNLTFSKYYFIREKREKKTKKLTNA